MGDTNWTDVQDLWYDIIWNTPEDHGEDTTKQYDNNIGDSHGG